MTDRPEVRANVPNLAPAEHQTASSAAVDWALGPGSVTWRVLEDPAVFLVGLLREALLLTLHPPFAAAAFDHDSFGDDPVMRFRRVAMYTYGATYGSTADAERYSSIVRRRHDTITGIEPLTGLPYQANAEYENALTHVMLADSFLVAYETLHGRLPGAERDQFLREQKVPAALLGVNPDHLPDTYGQSVDFLAQARQHFATGLQARETITPFSTGSYPPGTVIGDLAPVKRAAAMFTARAVADMAISTMCDEERALLAIDRRPKLGSAWAVRKSFEALSAFFRTARGQRTWDEFVHERVAEILRQARDASNAPGSRARRTSYVVPDARPHFAALTGLDANWPGSTALYRLGRRSEC